MPTFSYFARNHTGSIITGTVSGRSQLEAARALRSEGKYVVRLHPADSSLEDLAKDALSPTGRAKPEEIIYFAHQLAGMVETGVPLVEALEATVDPSLSPPFRSTVEDIIARVQGGSELSSALAAHPRVFSPMFVHMVRASEKTGLLGTMLANVADYLTNQRELRKRIKGALLYPCCMVVFAIGAVIFLLTFVLPKFAAIYAGKQAALPLPTRILLNTSEFVAANWWVGAIAFALLGVAIMLGLRTPRGRHSLDWLRLHIPILGPMLQQTYVVRSLQTLGSMISAGVSVLEAVPIARDVVGNRLFGQTFDLALEHLETGEQLSAALAHSPYLPRNVLQMIRAGERTGTLGPTMSRVAGLCEADLKHAIQASTQFIEPILISCLGVIIGGIAIAVLMPIFQVSRIVAQ